MLTERFRRSLLTLVVCLWGGMPLHAAWAAGGFAEHIVEAVRFYENLDYELALEQLQLARGQSRSAEDTVTVALYEGIIQAEMGNWEQSRAAFREALKGNLEARLPQRVSPKLRREFESQRALVQEASEEPREDVPALAGRQPAPSGEAGAGGGQPTRGAPGAAAQARTERLEPGPALVPSVTENPALAMVAPRSSSGAVRARRVPVLTWALLGAGVAAGGAGTFFGITSRNQLDAARSAMLRNELAASHARSQRSAQTANILFGAAGLAAAGAVVTWMLGGSPAEPVQGVVP